MYLLPTKTNEDITNSVDAMQKKHIFQRVTRTHSKMTLLYTVVDMCYFALSLTPPTQPDKSTM